MIKHTSRKGLSANYKVNLLFIVLFTAILLPSCMNAPIGKSYKAKYITEFYTERNSTLYHISKLNFSGVDKSTNFDFDVTFENHESKYDSIRFAFSLYSEFPIKTIEKVNIEFQGNSITMSEFETYYLEPKTKGWESRFSSFINFKQFKQLFKTDASPVFNINYLKGGESKKIQFKKCKDWDKVVEAVNKNIFILTDLD